MAQHEQYDVLSSSRSTSSLVWTFYLQTPEIKNLKVLSRVNKQAISSVHPDQSNGLAKLGFKTLLQFEESEVVLHPFGR